jgi:hypothetical protein
VHTTDFVLFMKVGVHGGESLDSIVNRKRREQADHGYFLWGYGGTLCHPQTQVDPFVERATHEAVGESVMVVMIPTLSRHLGRENVATHYSSDRREWRALKGSQVVTASRFALVCRNLVSPEQPCAVNLAAYAVAVGPSQGKPVSHYLRGRVDKACAERATGDDGREVDAQVILTAELVHPFAVCLR